MVRGKTERMGWKVRARNPGGTWVLLCMRGEALSMTHGVRSDLFPSDYSSRSHTAEQLCAPESCRGHPLSWAALSVVFAPSKWLPWAEKTCIQTCIHASMMRILSAPTL